MTGLRFRCGASSWAPRIAAILGLLAIVLAARLPNTSRLLAVLNDAAHAPVFGLISLLVLGLMRHSEPHRRTAAAFIITMVIGLAVEAAQGFAGRDASWYDLLTDALGALCALALHRWFRGSPPRSAPLRSAPLLVAFVTGTAILYPVAEAYAAYALRAASFPELLNPGRPLRLYFVDSNRVDLAPTPLPAPWHKPGDPPSLKATILRGQYPSIGLAEPYPDWRGKRALKLDVTNAGDDALALTLRVHDRAHDNQLSDRFNRTFELEPHTRVILSVPLRDISAAPRERALRLDQVAGLILFASGTAAQPGQILYVTRIWLE